MTTWLLNFLIVEGLAEVVEKFAKGTNPFIKTPPVKGSYPPEWTWPVTMSSGFVSRLYIIPLISAFLTSNFRYRWYWPASRRGVT
jgi:hypothetical protein